jgi:tRNA 5-methylaminomethyl-2-thiouridine biosynthesis bifunctional protein
LVGQVPLVRRFKEEFSFYDISHPCHRYNQSAYHPGLFLSVGHGSTGLTTCPLSAEVIAAQAFDEPLPLDEDLSSAIHPARFLARRLKRGQELPTAI